MRRRIDAAVIAFLGRLRDTGLFTTRLATTLNALYPLLRFAAALRVVARVFGIYDEWIKK